MKIIKNHLHIGTKEPFCVLHASDTHIAFADNRETERKLELSARRKDVGNQIISDLHCCCKIYKYMLSYQYIGRKPVFL